MGRGRQVVDRLTELAQQVDGELTAARLSHAHSVERFAILTEPASAAMRVYQRVGFKASERSTRALRFPRGYVSVARST